jgi:hypothetical protein
MKVFVKKGKKGCSGKAHGEEKVTVEEKQNDAVLWFFFFFFLILRRVF